MVIVQCTGGWACCLGLDGLRDYYGTENYIRLHHHLGDCYLINIDEALVYAD